MSSAILIEIIGGIALIYVFILANKKILDEVKTHKISITSIFAALVLCIEILVILLDRNPVNSVVNDLRIVLSSILFVLLSCLIDNNLCRYLKYLLIPTYVQFAACIFNILYEWSTFFIITNIIIQTYSSVLILRSSYIVTKNNNTKKPFLLTSAFFVVASYVIENISGNIVVGTFAAIFLLLYYIFLQEEQMYIDSLTGIENRWAFDKKMAEMQKENNVAIIVFDLNNLKAINDTFGHLIGDNCLADIARIIKISFADIGISYRIGGDEFCVLCHNVDKEKLKADFYKLELMVVDLKNSRSMPIDVAYGYEIYNKFRYNNIYDSFTKADLAMYSHKAAMKK
ncbi:MAG: GGDEF domain-containing protein [Eubacteriales bacterium]|nr:GGDEF domain-containing protein [Eubacteriales bacterium]